MRNPSREGSALVIVLAIAFLLATQVYILMVFTSGGFRHTEKANAHVRAIYIGESAFSRITARLKGAAWEDRWFQGGAVTENDVDLLDGRYSSYIRTVPHPDDKLADVWIKGRFQDSLATLYYRVLYVDDTLDFTAQVYPQFFSFIPDADPNPIDDQLPPSLEIVQTMMLEQGNNRDNALDLLDQMRSKNDLPSITGMLDIQDVPWDQTSPVDQADVSIPQAQYLLNSGAGMTAVGAPPPPPPPPPAVPDGGVMQNFLPQLAQIIGTHTGIQLSVPATGVQQNALDGTLDPNVVKMWNKANVHYAAKKEKWCHIMNAHIPEMFMALSTNAAPGNASYLIMSDLLAWMNTQTLAAVASAPPGSPSLPIADLSPNLLDSKSVLETLTAYQNWLCDTQLACCR